MKRYRELEYEAAQLRLVDQVLRFGERHPTPLALSLLLVVLDDLFDLDCEDLDHAWRDTAIIQMLGVGIIADRFLVSLALDARFSATWWGALPSMGQPRGSTQRPEFRPVTASISKVSAVLPGR